MVQSPTSGCFTTLRCTFAEGQAPDPNPSAPGGAQDPLRLFSQRPKLVPAKREPEPDTKKPTELTPNLFAALNRWDEPPIKELIQQGFSADDIEKQIYPGHEPQAKERIARAVANSFSAVFGKKKSKVTLTAAKEAKSASDEVASGAAAVAESIEELRDALQWGIPHRKIKNIRQVTPKVGQKIQVTCPTRNIYIYILVETWQKGSLQSHRGLLP